ncbi:MAG: TIGR03364 family FAD-dependent oxidoreductase [Neisseriaceae bacterium]|nr:TIGR03364 family FAD-dependent oxidoreductase [Neisseriaceae bacterium]
MSFDVAVVGSGILGLSHAYAAAEKGLKVLLLERNSMPNEASVRNFGFAMVLGQAPGNMLALANRSHELWGHFAQNVGFNVFTKGSLLFARNKLEASLLESFYEGPGQSQPYGCSLLTASEINKLYDGRFSRYQRALHGAKERVVYSREAIPALAKWVGSHPNITFKTNTLVYDIDETQATLRTTQGEFHADHVFVCSGHDYQTLFSKEIAPLNPIVCRLQMLRVRPTQAFNLEHGVFTGLSCLHYDAFADLPEIAPLQQLVNEETPLIEKYKIHLLMTPTPYGDIIIGDSHDYHTEAIQPFASSEIDDLILNLAQETLGQKVDVVERWQGFYGSKGAEPISILKPSPKVTIVLMRTGLGMSVGPALGEQNVNALL